MKKPYVSDIDRLSQELAAALSSQPREEGQRVIEALHASINESNTDLIDHQAALWVRPNKSFCFKVFDTMSQELKATHDSPVAVLPVPLEHDGERVGTFQHDRFFPAGIIAKTFLQTILVPVGENQSSLILDFEGLLVNQPRWGVAMIVIKLCENKKVSFTIPSQRKCEFHLAKDTTLEVTVIGVAPFINTTGILDKIRDRNVDSEVSS